MTAILQLLVLSAIPVVIFALWSEYFKAARALQSDDENESLELEARIRMAGLLTTIAQLFMFMASGSIRHENPTAGLAGLLITLGALVVQAQIQWSLRVSIAKDPAAAREKIRQETSGGGGVFGRALLWASLGALSHFAIVFGFAAGSLLFANWAGVSKAAMLAIVICSTFAGFGSAMILNFALAPLFMRKVLPAEQISDPELIGKIAESFVRAGLKLPDFWLIKGGETRFANAWVAGFTSGRGWFRPGLFLSESLLKSLDSNELRAVVSHEVAHLSLKHLQRRFFTALSFGIGLIFVAAAVSFVIAVKATPPMVGWMGLLGPVLGVVCVFGIMRYLGSQVSRCELEADHHAVAVMGADVEALISALKKLDGINGIPLSGRPPGQASAMSPLTGHPATEKRIELLRRDFPTPREASEDSRKAA